MRWLKGETTSAPKQQPAKKIVGKNSQRAALVAPCQAVEVIYETLLWRCLKKINRQVFMC